MSATRTFAAFTGGGAGGAMQAGDKFGHQKAETIRQDLDLLAYIGDCIPLGGHQAIGYVTGAATWEAVDPSFTYSLNGSTLGGMTIDLVVTSWTENAAQAVQVRLRNTTDSSNAAISTSHSGTSATLETVTGVTLAAGIKSYRLEILGGATYAVMATAYLRIRDIAA